MYKTTSPFKSKGFFFYHTTFLLGLEDITEIFCKRRKNITGEEEGKGKEKQRFLIGRRAHCKTKTFIEDTNFQDRNIMVIRKKKCFCWPSVII